MRIQIVAAAFLLWASLLAAACSAGPFPEPSELDADPSGSVDSGVDAQLPSCASVGCPEPTSACTVSGRCSCLQADGGVVSCERAPARFADAAIDGEPIAVTDAAERVKPDASAD